MADTTSSPEARLESGGEGKAPLSRLRLTLHYDGSAFHGWQVQPGVQTVQEQVEAAVSRLTDRPIRVIASGRTDAGVHAAGQVVSLDVPAKWTPHALRRSLNAVLPQEIRVAAAEPAAPGFHARYDAIARAYVYRVGVRGGAASPFRRRWCWPLEAGRGVHLDRELLARAAAALRGERSFAAFAKAGQEERGDRCRVLRSEWSDWRWGLQYTVVADRFLHHMVRYLVGTMVEVARARRPAAEMDALLAGESGATTSPPAPSQGLFLARVYYDASDLNLEEPLDEDLP